MKPNQIIVGMIIYDMASRYFLNADLKTGSILEKAMPLTFNSLKINDDFVYKVWASNLEEIGFEYCSDFELWLQLKRAHFRSLEFVNSESLVKEESA